MHEDHGLQQDNGPQQDNEYGVLHEAKECNIDSQVVLHAVAQAMLILRWYCMRWHMQC
jgi:hypothetical protein